MNITFVIFAAFNHHHQFIIIVVVVVIIISFSFTKEPPSRDRFQRERLGTAFPKLF